MLTTRKRGKSFHVDYFSGATRLRGSLGTRNHAAAQRLSHRLETALSEGADSELWSELKASLPELTFSRFADFSGATEKLAAKEAEEANRPTWHDLSTAFELHLAQRVTINKLRESTAAPYRVTVKDFGVFLEERKITFLHDIDKPLVESFKVWRVQRINQKKFSRGATGLVLDVAILHRLFSFAVDSEWTLRNPVRMEGRPGENPHGGAEPFTGDELTRLRAHAGHDLLAFLLLRWTGLRGGDAVVLSWREVHLQTKEIERVTQKRGRKVILPIHTELLFALEAERDKRSPQATDQILKNPSTGTPLTRPRLYERMLALGHRAGVPNAHPHRFRDTLAVDMLSRGASPYDVAKMLGDTIETIERHYTPFVRELRERVRAILESDTGLENALTSDSARNSVTPVSQSNGTIQ
jgi:integrase